MPKSVLTKPELDYLDVAFPDDRKRESTKPDGVSVEALRQSALAFARAIMEQCPYSADRSVALRSVRDALHHAIESLSKVFPKG